MKVIECVPNFSEGRNLTIIKKITDAIESVSSVTLLDVDPGADTNRTVVTFVGDPDSVISAAFLGIKKAAELIDMNLHNGEHARMGSTDVCPFIPISNINIEECIKYSEILAKMVSDELGIPIFLYELSAKNNKRKNLANIREGEYEGLKDKMRHNQWKPDFGANIPHPTSGAMAIGVRNFLIAYNINLNTKDRKLATDIALDIREKGRNKRDKNGKFIRDKDGIPIKKPGIFKSCKAVGWYIEEYGQAQVSINLTDYNESPPHIVFDEVRKQANKRGLRVTGSEIVGLIPLDAIISAGIYFLKKQRRLIGIPDNEIINIAIKSMGLNEISIFNPNEKIIEYMTNKSNNKLAIMPFHDFSDLLSSDAPAPGGGSVSAMAGSLAAALTSMVANLTFGLKKWEPLYDNMNTISFKAQMLKSKLTGLIDQDTDSFEEVMNAYKMPKKTNTEIKSRNIAIENSYKDATRIPFNTLKSCLEVLKLSNQVSNIGNENAISDAGVATEMSYAGLRGALLNITINLKEINDEKFIKKITKESNSILKQADKLLKTNREIVKIKLSNE